MHTKKACKHCGASPAVHGTRCATCYAEYRKPQAAAFRKRMRERARNCSRCGAAALEYSYYCRECTRAVNRACPSAKSTARTPLKHHRDLARFAARAVQLEKLKCEDCGNPAVERHHEDYSRPLEVTPLCGACHLKRHGKSKLQR